MKLTDFRALTFDCYGTLIDWETGMLAALEPLAARSKPPRSRDEILEAYGEHESSQEHYTPALKYSQLLAVTYKRIAENWRTPATWTNAWRSASRCASGPHSPTPWPR